MNRSDRQLVADYIAGDEQSLEDLIKRYLKPIYNFAYRYTGSRQDAEDIAQEVFVKAWRSLDKFDQRRSFKAWIFSIAKNTCLDALKKKKPELFSKFEDEKGENAIIRTLADSVPLPNEILERADTAKALNAVVRELSLKYRLVLFSRYNDHLTFREIAEMLGKPLNTVKSWHRRALIELRGLFCKP